MGASIQVDDKTAVVEGVDHLTGAPIQACDLRAGAALVIAALAAKGESEISCVQYIERGYEDIVTKLQGCLLYTSTETDRMTHIVQDLLTLSRLDAGNAELVLSGGV